MNRILAEPRHPHAAPGKLRKTVFQARPAQCAVIRIEIRLQIGRKGPGFIIIKGFLRKIHRKLKHGLNIGILG